MSRNGVAERGQLVLLLASRAARRAWGWLAGVPLLAPQMATPLPDRIVIAPQDLRTTDPTRAGEIYAGRFAFAGKVVEGLGRSPFSVEPPSEEWARELHGFSWLRHMRAADSALARAHARVLVEEWIALRGGSSRVAWQPETVARRVVSWLSQSPLVLEGADRMFYRRFLRSLGRQVRFLRRAVKDGRPGLPHLAVTVALCHAGLCISGQGRLQRFATRQLGRELERQILPDGGHVSRNPQALLTLMLDLLPLKQAYSVENVAPPPALLNAIDRIMPMLRFFGHGDGSFGLFNGMGPTPVDVVASVLAFDDTKGAPVQNAQYSGYQRLEGGRTVVLMDTGALPPGPLGRDMHAGCLSFELSDNAHRLIVNCGLPGANRDAWRAAARASAAHSTLVLADTSSCRFAASPRLERALGTAVISGPVEVPVMRRDEDGSLVRATHDGFAKRFRLLHERTVDLAPAGDLLDGRDRLLPAAGRAARAAQPFALRFHLHPGVRASRVQDGRAVLLILPNRVGWLFTAQDRAIELEESIFLASPGSPRRSEQMVVYCSTAEATDIGWRLERTGSGGRRGRDGTQGDLPI